MFPLIRLWVYWNAGDISWTRTSDYQVFNIHWQLQTPGVGVWGFIVWNALRMFKVFPPTWAFPCLLLAMACGAGSGLLAHTESAARADRVSSMTPRLGIPPDTLRPHRNIATRQHPGAPHHTIPHCARCPIDSLHRCTTFVYRRRRNPI